mmetsp:Transcript_19073/g.32678  ORF Transcript_19073/g.32678 Transcript_19073/m.32678 type:complete len:217 (-) Transcript_19073:1218-1868(-)
MGWGCSRAAEWLTYSGSAKAWGPAVQPAHGATARERTTKRHNVSQSAEPTSVRRHARSAVRRGARSAVRPAEPAAVQQLAGAAAVRWHAGVAAVHRHAGLAALQQPGVSAVCTSAHASLYQPGACPGAVAARPGHVLMQLDRCPERCCGVRVGTRCARCKSDRTGGVYDGSWQQGGHCAETAVRSVGYDKGPVAPRPGTDIRATDSRQCEARCQQD